MATVTERAPASNGLRVGWTFDWVESFLFVVKAFSAFVILWGLIGYIALASSGEALTGEALRDLIVAGVAQGSMYGLIALGYSMVYGVLGFINFAHGEVFMSGAIVGYFTADAFFRTGMWTNNFYVSIVVVLLAAVATSTALAVLIERIAYRPLRGAPRLIPLITSIGVSFFIQNAVLGLTGPTVKTYPPLTEVGLPEWVTGRVNFGIFAIDGTKLIAVVVALLSMLVLYQFVTRTKTGRAMRAVAEDKEIAALMGINVDRTIVTTFAVGGSMAGVAALLWAILFRGVNSFTGFLPGIKAFTAAVLGGIGNLVGAMIGGIALGVFEGVGPQTILFGLRWEVPLWLGLVLLATGVLAVVSGRARGTSRLYLPGAIAILGGVAGVLSWSQTIPGLFQIKDVVAFYALFLVLIFRPSGLLGERLALEDRA
ncbi:MAG TPA: branched-chain amino acid ABC transporter permease [Acidimicrobiia bacterium]